jgi:hypothetical protein
LVNLTHSRALLANDLVSSAGILALIALPGKTSHGRSCCHWPRGSSAPAPAQSVFDVSKMEAAARAESGVGATGEAQRSTEE